MEQFYSLDLVKSLSMKWIEIERERDEKSRTGKWANHRNQLGTGRTE